MIVSFNDKETEKIWKQEWSKKYSKDIQKVILRKLIILHRSLTLNDLNVPPSNHLEKLKGDRKDSYSIRINDQFRICFYWNSGNASEVEVVDYH